jgi:virginiamycin B lyase
MRRQRSIFAAVGSVLAVLALGWTAAGAQAHVYWTNLQTGTIGRANQDGSSPTQALITGASAPGGIAVEGNFVYWANQDSNSIGRAQLDGTGAVQSFITGASSPVGIAVDDNFVYWANQGSNSIGRARLDGTGATQSFITGTSNTYAVAVDGQHIYWTNANTGSIGQANLDGTSPVQNFITGANNPVGVAVDGQHIYWSNANIGKIGRANLDGTSPNQQYVDAPGMPFGLAVDGQSIYWADRQNNRIGKATLDAVTVTPAFIPGASTPVGVAVDHPSAPSASITSPADGAAYSQGTAVTATYTCSPGAGGGVLVAGSSGCAGTVPNGSRIDTASLGAHAFTVTATDTDGQTAAVTARYTVTGGSPASAGPTASIASPADGARLTQGSVVDASYACQAGLGGGILRAGSSGCAGTVPSGQPIDTTGLGAHAFTVTATDTDGQTAASTSRYTVVTAAPAPPVTAPPRNIVRPSIVEVTGSPHVYSCSPGTWVGAEGNFEVSGRVVTFTYTWQRLTPDPNYLGGYRIDTIASGQIYRPIAGSAFVLATQSWIVRCVVATSNAGGLSTATSPSRTLSPALGPHLVNPTFDIDVAGIEVTQAIQTSSCTCAGTLPSRDQHDVMTPGQAAYQGVTMAAGKFTVVRVYANFLQPAGLASLPGATAQLEVLGANGDRISTLTPDSAPSAIGPPICGACVSLKERTNPAASFNFLVPWDETLHGSLSFRATVRPPVGLGEPTQCAGCHANSFTLTDVPFVPTATVPIHPIPLTAGGTQTAKNVNQVFGTAQTVLPVNVQIFPYGTPLAVDGLNNPQAAAAVDQRAIDNNVDDTQYLIGVFAKGEGQLTNGLTLPGKVLDGGVGPPISIVQDARPMTSVTHEIGHGLGLVHADTGSGPGSAGPHPDGTPDCGGNSNLQNGGQGLPQTGEAWPPDNEGQLDGVGLDRRNWNIYQTGSLPTTFVNHFPAMNSIYYDFMSYCPFPPGVSEAADWISVRNWTCLIVFPAPCPLIATLASATAATATRAVRPVRPVRPVRAVRSRTAGSTPLLVIATVDSSDQTSMFDVVPGERASAPPTAGSAYRVQLDDSAGRMLSSVVPAANLVHIDHQRPGLVLEATLPFLPAAASVSVTANGVTLTSRTRSAHPPTVEFLSPRGGSQLGRAATTSVRWSARDADGDHLTSTIEYSADAGRDWKVVASNVPGTSARIPSPSLSASGDARLRVRVSDGFNATIATSGRLRAVGARPLVSIADAGHRGRVRADGKLLLQGSAFDDAGRPLTAGHLKWYSGRRLLGHGGLLTVSGLAAGALSIRLIATDMRGRSSAALLHLTVFAPLPRFLASRAPTQISAHARHVRIVVASTERAILTIVGRRYTVNRKPRTITVPIRPGHSILRLRYTLRSGGGVTRGLYLAAR